MYENSDYQIFSLCLMYIKPNNKYKAEDSKNTLFKPVTTIKFKSYVVDK